MQKERVSLEILVRQQFVKWAFLNSSFNGKPQATAFAKQRCKIACGLPLNEQSQRTIQNFESQKFTDPPPSEQRRKSIHCVSRRKAGRELLELVRSAAQTSEVSKTS